MTDFNKGQCEYFVVRKKRLCRMTVKPGKHYCGEHEPQPINPVDNDKEDLRVACPYDPKHTCFASKLEKHLRICNAREQELPDYIIHNVNAPAKDTDCPRVLLNDVSTEKISNVIDKINILFDELLKDEIMDLPEKPIHRVVEEEFAKTGRKESSLRHLRQVSRLLHLIEEEGMVQPDTCYIELGAGKGRLAAMAWNAWCASGGDSGGVLLVERAALRHKRDNSTGATRLRADLAHVVLARVAQVRRARAVVGLAKHLCGVATDYALRSMCAGGVLDKVRGVVVATCCHHRCDAAATVAVDQLLKLGITAEEFNVMLGVVSWATCGDGRSRERRAAGDHDHGRSSSPRNGSRDQNVGDHVAGEMHNNNLGPVDNHGTDLDNFFKNDNEIHKLEARQMEKNGSDDLENIDMQSDVNAPGDQEVLGTKQLGLDREARERVGRRAKALIDWGRVLHLREHGFDARLVHFVPAAVSLENFCIVAKKEV